MEGNTKRTHSGLTAQGQDDTSVTQCQEKAEERKYSFLFWLWHRGEGGGKSNAHCCPIARKIF
jgi:hypothetical protein